MAFETVSVISGGAWGTALAQTFAASGKAVWLWAREAEVVDDINARHVNRTFLPGIELDHRIRATASLEDVVASDVILSVTPAQFVRAMAEDMRPLLATSTPIVMCSKGIEQKTGLLMSDVFAHVLPETPFAVLSGPSFAADVARGLPAALTLACADEGLGRQLAGSLSSRQMRLYWSGDVIGAELGGAVKNVIAIAAGIVDGKGLGASAHAALVTRGFAEMRRLGEALGARPETLLGLSGLGDLILTCGSAQSRNMSLGRGLGEGRSIESILGKRVAVTEGVFTARAVVTLAREKGIEMPIAEAVFAVIEGQSTVEDAIRNLMLRPLKAED